MLGELTATEVERLLQSEPIARIGCHVEGRTYVVPVAYVYADGSLIGDSAEGLKLRMLRKNPDVCVEIEHVDDLANWRSVIAWRGLGTADTVCLGAATLIAAIVLGGWALPA